MKEDDVPLMVVLVIAFVCLMYIVFRLVHGRAKREKVYNKLVIQIGACTTMKQWNAVYDEVHQFMRSLDDKYEAKKFIWLPDLTRLLRDKYDELGSLN
jgi:hypothetical protein